MQIHQLKKKHPNKTKKIGGRGGSRGKTSGRGHKGQKSRAGRKLRPEMRDIIKKIPKKRGYRFNSIQKKPVIVTLDSLSKNFSDGDTINPKILVEKLIIKTQKGCLPKVKILNTGEMKKKVVIVKCLISSSARAKIEKVGGVIK